MPFYWLKILFYFLNGGIRKGWGHYKHIIFENLLNNVNIYLNLNWFPFNFLFLQIMNISLYLIRITFFFSLSYPVNKIADDAVCMLWSIYAFSIYCKCNSIRKKQNLDYLIFTHMTHQGWDFFYSAQKDLFHDYWPLMTSCH